MGTTPRPAHVRVYEKLSPLADCWIYGADPSRYHTVTVRGGHQQRSPAHRVMYEAMVAEIPDGLELDHLCRTPACCNPYHLDPVPHEINLNRSRRTHCKRGHEFTPQNTRVRPTGKECRTCGRQYALAAYYAKRTTK